MKTKNTKEVNKDFDKLFNEDNDDDSYKFNQDIETIEDYRNETMRLYGDLCESVSRDIHWNNNNLLYENSDMSMLKKMFTLGQIDILSRLRTEQQLRRL